MLWCQCLYHDKMHRLIWHMTYLRYDIFLRECAIISEPTIDSKPRKKTLDGSQSSFANFLSELTYLQRVRLQRSNKVEKAFFCYTKMASRKQLFN